MATRYFLMSGATPDIMPGNEGLYQTGLTSWNVAPDVGYVLEIDRNSDNSGRSFYTLWNWNQTQIVGRAEREFGSVEENYITFIPEPGQLIETQDDLPHHVKFDYSSFYFEGKDKQFLRIPPLGNLPDVNHPIYAPFPYYRYPGSDFVDHTADLAIDKAVNALHLGTQDVLRVTATYPKGLAVKLGDQIYLFEAAKLIGDYPLYVESIEREFTPDGTSVTITAFRYGEEHIVPE